jgi:hypothetical protein
MGVKYDLLRRDYMDYQDLLIKLSELQKYIIELLSDSSLSISDLQPYYKEVKYLKFLKHDYKQLIDLSEFERRERFELYLIASKRRKDMKYRINKKIKKFMVFPAFFTITFTDDKLQIDYKNELRKLFKRYNIKHYVLISDYGAKTGRIHFHGFIDIAYLSADLFEQTGVDKRYWNFIPLNKFGWNTVSNYGDYTRAINYATKYMTKDYIFKHSSFSSRSPKRSTSFEFTMSFECRYAKYQKLLKSSKKFFSFDLYNNIL